MTRHTDKEVEHRRYDDRAKRLLSKDNVIGLDYVDQLSASIRAPYLCFRQMIREHALNPNGTILEIGAGTGALTGVLLQSGANVIATDISETSLKILHRNLSSHGSLDTKVADMEALPFDDHSFDMVVSAGSLSYGDNNVVINEIYRVLKPSGVFICVDSLNHNLIYRFNRWLHYLRGKRTKSTLVRMPSISLINLYEKKFGHVSAAYFGALTWLAPLFKFIMTEEIAGNIIDWFDRIAGIKRSAFKFVMLAEKKEQEVGS